jgi:hypothetical protein
MKGEIIDHRIVPGVLITLNQRIKHVPFAVRNMPGFDIISTTVPVWDTAGRNYEYVPSGSVASVIGRYGDPAGVTKLEVIVNGQFYNCYGTHADLLE